MLSSLCSQWHPILKYLQKMRKSHNVCAWTTEKAGDSPHQFLNISIRINSGHSDLESKIFYGDSEVWLTNIWPHTTVQGITLQLEPLCGKDGKKWELLGQNSPTHFRWLLSNEVRKAQVYRNAFLCAMCLSMRLISQVHLSERYTEVILSSSVTPDLSCQQWQ